MSGVHASRILRIVTQSEASRVALVSEAKTQGLHEVNGVPIEDFVVVESSAQAVYDKYVKPLGF
jgi:orotate phosphoribosyltransferase-like protein